MPNAPTAPHRHPVKVRFYELDPYGHLNHSVYVQLFEIGRIELLDEAGLGLHDLDAEGFRFVVSRITTKFLASAVAGDNLVIETEVLELRRASSRWGQRLLRGDAVLATQEVVAAVTGTNGRPTRFPTDMAARLTPYLVADPPPSVVAAGGAGT
ncbi:MAG: thioesterase family protein [Acidimicrobiales bacterium]|nr:thioesterase family protein [Acidimicrobiales bacterium]